MRETTLSNSTLQHLVQTQNPGEAPWLWTVEASTGRLRRNILFQAKDGKTLTGNHEISSGIHRFYIEQGSPLGMGSLVAEIPVQGAGDQPLADIWSRLHPLRDAAQHRLCIASLLADAFLRANGHAGYSWELSAGLNVRPIGSRRHKPLSRLLLTPQSLPPALLADAFHRHSATYMNQSWGPASQTLHGEAGPDASAHARLALARRITEEAGTYLSTALARTVIAHIP